MTADFDKRFADIEQDIEKSRTLKNGFGRWMGRFGKVAIGAFAGILLLKAAPVIIVLGPVFLVSVVGLAVTSGMYVTEDRSLDKKYRLQAEMILSRTRAQEEPAVAAGLQANAGPAFNGQSRIDRLEKKVETLQVQVEGKPAVIDKPARNKGL